jgi:hypothetical protein
VWAWTQLAAIGTELTGYPSHSVFEDFTWDPSVTMSGASDDWAYEHLGIYGWTTEFWDVVHAATGTKQSTHFWYTGPTDAERLAVARWLDTLPDAGPATRGLVDWYPFDHPQLGAVELGGWNQLHSWTNPPPHLLLAEVDRHADFAVAQALAAPCIEIRHTAVEPVGDDTWRVTVGVANTGWLPTTVTAHARLHDLVRPVVAELHAAPASGTAVEVVDGPHRRPLGQLAGSSSARFTDGTDGTPDRTTCAWLVRAPAGTPVAIEVRHQRAGTDSVTVILGGGAVPPP